MDDTESRTVKYDRELHVEAYHFQGIMQRFPNHFHEYYVVGFIEKGKRHLSCRNREYTIEPGDLVLFNPRDNHTCEQIDGRTLDYRCLNIQPEVMQKAVRDITGSEVLPRFTESVVFHSELIPPLRELHLKIMTAERDFKKEELFLFLLGQLIEEYAGQPHIPAETEESTAVKTVAGFLEKNYARTITLDELSVLTNVSKYYLLRSFTKQKGISPYSYLETIRIDKAKTLLSQGVPPAEAAAETGFSDQSHFTNFFKKFIGLTPKQYMTIFSGGERQHE
jgi:AraC-like DNA-binding protein